MRWAIDLVLLAILLLCGWNGYRKGFITSIGGVLSIAVALYAACLISGTFSYEVVPVVRPFASGFVERVISRYRQLRQGVLSEEYLLAYQKDIETWLGSAVDRNFSVWGYTFDPNQVSNQERRFPAIGSGDTSRDVNPSSYEEAVEWMMDYIVDRGQWMDEHIDSLRQYCHPSYSANQRVH